jgi:ubiquinone/menaquinone biosynthesis C-methylase UbiE
VSRGRRAVDIINRAVRRTGFELVPTDGPAEMVWDRDFRRWIRQAESAGVDPNDIADERWGEDLLAEGLSDHYLPLVHPDAVILELGPGTGRLTRHVVGSCKEVIVVDRSSFVCDWMRRYLRGRGAHRVYRIDGPALPMIADGEVDAVMAHGVAEHLDLDEIYWFLAEFHRVLRPGGTIAFNFDNVLTERGAEVMLQDGPGERALFRVHHPAAIRRVGELAGFREMRIVETPGRIAFAEISHAP